LEVHYNSCSQKKIQNSLCINSQQYTSKILELEKDNKYLRDEIEKQRDEIEKQRDEIEKQQNKYEEQIKTLQDKLENIALQAVSRPTTTNKTQINNFIQNMEPITKEKLVEYTPQLTLEHIQKGASGYAEYALEYPLKDRLICVDYSRRKIKFKNKEGDLIADPEMVKLAPMFFESIKDKSSQIVYSQNDPNMDSAMFEQVAKLFNMNSDVKNASDGVKSDFYHDFVKHVCSGSVVDSF
jgi:seryl-tRNA synthetase